MKDYVPIYPLQFSLKCWVWNKNKTIRSIRQKLHLANIGVELEEAKWSFWPVSIHVMFRVTDGEPEISEKPIREISDDRLTHILKGDTVNLLNNLKGGK